MVKSTNLAKARLCAHLYGNHDWACRLCGYKLSERLQRRVLEVNQDRSEITWRPAVTIKETVRRPAQR